MHAFSFRGDVSERLLLLLCLDLAIFDGHTADARGARFNVGIKETVNEDARADLFALGSVLGEEEEKFRIGFYHMGVDGKVIVELNLVRIRAERRIRDGYVHILIDALAFLKAGNVHIVATFIFDHRGRPEALGTITELRGDTLIMPLVRARIIGGIDLDTRYDTIIV